MNKKEEKSEELVKEVEGVLILEKTGEPIASVSDVASKAEEMFKKRDTSFVAVRKTQIELYGSYYPAGLSDQEILEWVLSENHKLQKYLGNLHFLETTTLAKIESDVDEKLAAFANSLSPEAKEKLKSIIA